MNKCLLSSNFDEWETPDYLFNYLDRIFNFTLDAACNHSNCKCLNGYTKIEDGLKQEWRGYVVFCNPPYGRNLKKWIIKGFYECVSNNVLSVFLIPARTDTIYFHDYILNIADIFFIKGRIKFKNALSSAPFPSMICIFNPDNFHHGKCIINSLDIKDILEVI